MGRIKEFDYNSFTVYDLSRRLRMPYAKALLFVKNLLCAELIERAVANDISDGRTRRYKIICQEITINALSAKAKSLRQKKSSSRQSS